MPCCNGGQRGIKKSYDFSPRAVSGFWFSAGRSGGVFFSVMVDADGREEIFRLDFDGPGRWGGEGGGLGRAEEGARVLEVIRGGILWHAWEEGGQGDGMRRFPCFRGSVEEAA
jgi:hypothetical protein